MRPILVSNSSRLVFRSRDYAYKTASPYDQINTLNIQRKISFGSILDEEKNSRLVNSSHQDHESQKVNTIID